ncbi:MAG: DNA polymerase III subunit beta [Actinomycetota bacterium]|nr:DNA polymerase III subunit beta [Actinomycetota bacterium]
MRFTVARGELLESLSAASRGLSSRSTLPILSGILVSSKGSEVVFQATDLEISVRSSVAANVEKEGQAVLPGKLISDIVRSLPEAAVTVFLEGDTASIACGQSSFTVKTLPADDFPKFPEVSADTQIDVPTKVLSSVASRVSRAVSRDETRPVLTGVLVVVDGPSLRMVATDSYRLAVKEIILEKSGPTLEVVIPGKALDEVSRLSAGTESVHIGVAENQVSFSFGTTVFVTRRIEGTFPNYKQLIPKETETTVLVGREDLYAAVKRVSLLAQQNTPLRLSVSAEDQTLSLSATTQDIGDASEDLMVSASGPDVEIAFNHAFLADGLNSTDSESVSVEIVSPLKPGVIRAKEDEGFLYLLMPVRLG